MYKESYLDKCVLETIQDLNFRLGAVHKLCRLKGGGGGVKNCQFYLVKRQLRGGEGVENRRF